MVHSPKGSTQAQIFPSCALGIGPQSLARIFSPITQHEPLIIPPTPHPNLASQTTQGKTTTLHPQKLKKCTDNQAYAPISTHVPTLAYSLSYPPAACKCSCHARGSRKRGGIYCISLQLRTYYFAIYFFIPISEH